MIHEPKHPVRVQQAPTRMEQNGCFYLLMLLMILGLVTIAFFKGQWDWFTAFVVALVLLLAWLGQSPE